MGHHIGSKESIVPLIDRLNRYPVGLPDSEKLREILGLLFEEREAYVASRFPLEEATLSELCRLTKIDQEALLPILETMADKGLVMDLPYGGKTYYLLMPGLIGFFEFTFMKNRTDLPLEKIARLMTEYLFENPHQGMAREFFGSRTPLTRSLVYEEHIPVSSEITTYENAREIIRQAGFGAVGLCYCRHKKEHLGETCRKGAPVEEICISLGTAAKFMVRRGFAEPRTTEELLAVLDSAREQHLTHVTDNIRQKPSFICNCCSCCCELLAGVQAGYREGIAKTPYVAVLDAGSCSACGLCLEACNVAAIGDVEGEGGRTMVIDDTICLGCGACISSCRRQALSLGKREKRPLPPKTRQDLFVRILKEKRRLVPYLVSGVKKKVRRIFLP
ncbi:4Fe-4S ferredoxin [Desulfuromonas soudanensis]|uniref:4Fe-4S ferredoxin n=1 Tax=Desulfuromonas soudanensis TaxID=1603606 RepID=A0A0M4DIK2_9BACT|nr:4Fe-4S dicluster domain-containing protein [Desulfuromonas soudanensis]ALC16770.1 4Fe-4S ferredoxin [Desulfuromonas soudanensis]